MAGERAWWADDVLAAGSEGLLLDGRSVAALAARHGTPLYVYSTTAVLRQLARLRAALAETGAPTRIWYALKANRFAPLVGLLRAQGGVGIDACSPGEVERALASGFAPDEVSFTGGMLSDRDLDRLAAAGVHVNLDSRSALRRYGARVPAGTRVGLRLDPGVATGYGDSEKSSYGNSKFGFLRDDVDDALGVAHAAGLAVDTLHVHFGWGLQESALPRFEAALAAVAAAARRVPELTTVNVGGGLGARLREQDRPLPLDAWAAALRRHLAPLGVTIACEPGTLLVAKAGLLVVQVNTVERKGDHTWVGVDAGHNLNVYAAHYGLPLEIIKVTSPTAPPEQIVNVAGHINESVDVFARGRALPRLEEGDLLALYPAGAYGTAMASHHCLRGDHTELLIGVKLLIGVRP
jgi:diaminopimelate decarboxylase